MLLSYTGADKQPDANPSQVVIGWLTNLYFGLTTVQIWFEKNIDQQRILRLTSGEQAPES